MRNGNKNNGKIVIYLTFFSTVVVAFSLATAIFNIAYKLSQHLFWILFFFAQKGCLIYFIFIMIANRLKNTGLLKKIALSLFFQFPYFIFYFYCSQQKYINNNTLLMSHYFLIVVVISLWLFELICIHNSVQFHCRWLCFCYFLIQYKKILFSTHGVDFLTEN